MDWAQYYAQLSEMARAGQELGFFDNFFRLFYQAFIEGNRWQLYLRGLAVTLQLTVIALCIGIVLGVLVAVVRTAHDQQRLGRKSIFLSLCNILCQIYTTVIRGTMMGPRVQTIPPLWASCSTRATARCTPKQKPAVPAVSVLTPASPPSPAGR